jgi:hypothetical protein
MLHVIYRQEVKINKTDSWCIIIFIIRYSFLFLIDVLNYTIFLFGYLKHVHSFHITLIFCHQDRRHNAEILSFLFTNTNTSLVASDVTYSSFFVHIIVCWRVWALITDVIDSASGTTLYLTFALLLKKICIYQRVRYRWHLTVLLVRSVCLIIDRMNSIDLS